MRRPSLVTRRRFSHCNRLHQLIPARLPLSMERFACETGPMAMKELLGTSPRRRVSYAPSRMRKMLQSFLAKVELLPEGAFLNLNRVEASKARLRAEVEAALALYAKADQLEIALGQQRAEIAGQLTTWAHFISTANRGLIALQGEKPRRRLTVPEQTVAVGKRLLTRQQLGTLGKKQRKAKLAASRESK